MLKPVTERPNELARLAFYSELEVHKALGPGLLENAYEKCLAHELQLRGVSVRSQVPLPITYKELSIDQAYKIDLLVEESLVIELNAVEEIHPRHKAQLLTYLKYGNYQLGLLMNFHTHLFKNGVVRIVNSMPS